ncbi:TlpA family protein disulfide reductase [Butyricimonas faecalis]|uniref:TlpA family protein disulfide reductase n=2 Tax=Butyricimonas faecalis TaxID=2093856 RepID=A0A3Q9IT49_9BACT|nr:TlpA family protein disulfide reductase [Butyricimonas faecalis]
MDSTGVDFVGRCVIAVQKKGEIENVFWRCFVPCMCNNFVSQGRGESVSFDSALWFNNLRIMMKKLIYMAVLLLAVISARAQDYEAFNKFMREYSRGWMTDYMKPAGNTMTMVKQVGEPAPEFYFDKKLNSKALKGKFVVINFWSTWCGSCINLVHDLDTVLFRNMQPYEGVQFIGVDSHEKVSEREARKWWKDHGINYSCGYGKGADACAEAFHGNHPSVIIIDDQGIVRGRWDGRSPKLAEIVRMAIWVLKIVPEQGIQADLTTVKKLVEEKEYLKALYLLEIMPENIESATLKYQCKLEIFENSAIRYFDVIREKYRDDEQYLSVMESIMYLVLASDSKADAVIKNGLDAAESLLRSRRNGDYRVHEAMGILCYRYGESFKRKGVRALENSIPAAKMNREGDDVIKHLEEQVKIYRERLD